jgi:agmatinase
MHTLSLFVCLVCAQLCSSRQITFPPVAAVPYGAETRLGHGSDVLQDEAKFAGLTTFANVPWVHCLSKENDIEKYDIAILGAPFDTGTTARPGARFGPTGIRWGSRRINSHGYSAYSHRNVFQSWARIIDCGDAPLTFLDNTIALEQLGSAHKVVAGREANATEVATVPRIVALGGDHTTTLAALRSASKHFGPVSVIHFDR